MENLWRQRISIVMHFEVSRERGLIISGVAGVVSTSFSRWIWRCEHRFLFISRCVVVLLLFLYNFIYQELLFVVRDTDLLIEIVFEIELIWVGKLWPGRLLFMLIMWHTGVAHRAQMFSLLILD